MGLAYAGGVYYSLVSDDFHDYFTEYVPGGEEAVLFFEEREFKRRFPDGMGAATKMYPQVSGENKVTISGRSGASARVSDPKSSGAAAGGEKSDNVQKAKDAAPSPAAKGQPKAAEEKKKEPAPSTEKKPAPAPKQTEAKSSSSAPIAQIDILSLENAADPAVKKVTTILNDIISVVNADNASGKYSSALTKAKDDLKQLAAELATYKESQAQAAEAQIKKQDGEFEKAAKEMLSRVQQDQKEQELRWREEYENERARLSQTYQDKLQTELEAAQKVSEQRLHNELLQQNIKLQDSFAKTIRQQVETERDARLSKLNELSTAVSELESLTSKWNEVVDQNIKTQHLVVAVDAVRSALESTDRPTPFLHELVALKESSNNNGVVNAAIASINPVAYQRGVPTAAQLIDRFRRVAGEVRKAALLPEDAGIASHAASFVLSKVMFKKQGLAAGDDVESILTRTETLLEEGDLDEAAREMNGLTGWARVLSKDWLSDCRRVLEVKQAIEVSLWPHDCVYVDANMRINRSCQQKRNFKACSWNDCARSERARSRSTRELVWYTWLANNRSSRATKSYLHTIAMSPFKLAESHPCANSVLLSVGRS